MISLQIELDTTGYAADDKVTVKLNGRALLNKVKIEAGGITLQTKPLYYGLHTVEAIAFDALGNSQSGGSSEEELFLNTGPRPPESPRFHSQDGDGPVSIAFTPSPELPS